MRFEHQLEKYSFDCVKCNDLKKNVLRRFSVSQSVFFFEPGKSKTFTKLEHLQQSSEKLMTSTNDSLEAAVAAAATQLHQQQQQLKKLQMQQEQQQLKKLRQQQEMIQVRLSAVYVTDTKTSKNLESFR